MGLATYINLTIFLFVRIITRQTIPYLQPTSLWKPYSSEGEPLDEPEVYTPVDVT